MELRQLNYVIQIAMEKNFSRAAEKLHIAQPSLSQQLSKLEQEIGVLLFRRTTNSVELTHAGQVFVDKSQKILDAVEQLKQEMDDMAQMRRGTPCRRNAAYYRLAYPAACPSCLRRAISANRDRIGRGYDSQARTVDCKRRNGFKPAVPSAYRQLASLGAILGGRNLLGSPSPASTCPPRRPNRYFGFAGGAVYRSQARARLPPNNGRIMRAIRLLSANRVREQQYGNHTIARCRRHGNRLCPANAYSG